MFTPFKRLLLFLFFIPVLLHAQLSAPKAEAVYGGRINNIVAAALSPDSSRIFITTESANSAFYMDVKHTSPGIKPSYKAFSAIAGLDSKAGFGSNIQEIAAHAKSGFLFFLHNGDLYSSGPLGPKPFKIDSAGIQSLFVHADKLFYIKASGLHYGTLDAIGNFTPASSSPMILPPLMNQLSLAHHPINGSLYLFQSGISPSLYKSSDPLDSLNSMTTMKALPVIGMSTAVNWLSFSIAPDGTLFTAGSNFANKHISYAKNDSIWTSYSTMIGGAPGKNISFGGDASFYRVYYASIVNDSMGMPGKWQRFGMLGQETHPNDGPVLGDPTNFDVVYMTTDMGIGASHDKGDRIYEINEGVEAVQVNDFSMTLNKQTAWLASKSGIRKVSTYRSSPSWSGPMFPRGDGSPYYSAAMVGQDTQKVYACNLRVYKTVDGGNSWLRLFSAEHSPYNFPSAGNLTTGAAKINSVAVCPVDTQIVMVGYGIEWGDNGGLFYSMDGGNTWTQQLLEASTLGFDVNVMDIVFSKEGSDTVAYVGAEYNSSVSGGKSIYRLVKNGANWIVQQDMGPSGTSTGSSILVSISDLALSPSGDTLLASGTDVGSNHPVAYFKDINGSNLWTPYTTSGFPFIPGKVAKAVTYGIDTVYVAVDEDIYFLPVGASNWTLGYSYPKGTQIQFLYFDELLVGTETGLYGHLGQAGNSASIKEKIINNASQPYSLYPNPLENSSLFLELDDGINAQISLSLRNIQGQLIWEGNYLGERIIEIEQELMPSSGIYLLEVMINDKSYSNKIVVK